jgi:aminopeptidase YwaD
MKVFTSFFLLFYSYLSVAQNLQFYKNQIDTLCSETMYGRGYLKNGHKKAANYIEEELKKQGLNVIQQQFPMTVNVFPEVTNLIINDSIVLTVGKDFIPSPSSASLEGNYNLFYLDSTFFASKEKQEEFLNIKYLGNTVLVLHKKHVVNLMNMRRDLVQKKNKRKGVIILQDEPLMGSFSPEVSHRPNIQMLATSFPENAKHIQLTIKNEVKSLISQNIIAAPIKIKRKLPTLVITAHYDHLGGYGDSCFVSGANDNASGVAMILNMAKYFKEHPIKANLIFIAFGGEEAGLLGSSYYVTHPTFPLKKIDLVINFDLMGAGSKGIMVENGIELPSVYEAFVTENINESYVHTVKKRGNSPNSDHYPFTQKEVKAVFIYSLGNVGGYHNIMDSKEELEYQSYEALFNFMIHTIENQFIKL